jgi:hypothetical protein
MLPDAGNIQETEVATLNRRNAPRGRAAVTPIYTQADAIAALDQFRPVEYQAWYPVISGVRARYWNAGHLLGSASIELEFEDQGGDGRPLRVLMSGDIGPDAKLLELDPEGPTGLDYVFCESTYGDTDRPSTTPALRRSHLAQEVRDAAAERGALLIPAFAVERTQELIADLADLMARGEIPTAPIFLDSPLAIRATEVFRSHAASLDPTGIEPAAFHGDRRRKQVDCQALRLSYRYCRQRHVRCRSHPPSLEAVAVAQGMHGSSYGISGSRHVGTLSARWCKGSEDPRRGNQGRSKNQVHRRIFRTRRRTGA